MNKIYPILKNREEEKSQKEKGMYIDNFLSDFVGTAGPFVMYGEDYGGTMGFSASEGSEHDLEQKNEALANLREIDVPVSVEDADGIKLAIVQHEYAAEKILDSEFLKVIASRLGAEEIVVGIPMKCVMLAAPKNAEKKAQSTTIDAYNNFQTYPISKAIYSIVDGKIVAVSDADIA